MRRRWRPLVVGGGCVAVAAVAGGVVWALAAAGVTGSQPPGVGTTVVTPQDSRAAQAAADESATAAERDAAGDLAQQPTTYWITPEADPVDRVADRIADLADQARSQSATLAVTVYGLPGRDCGQFSAGGLAEPVYEEWTARIGHALAQAPGSKIVVLEPDSIALAPECGNVQERVRQLQGAIDRLSGPDTWIYVDGGHSEWLSASDIAAIIGAIDRADVIRGFATNVSNYNDTASEFAYAHELSGLLGGGHALVDTSRNGAGGLSGWCNPFGAVVGAAGGAYGDGVVDTNLWIKPPGESDGTCNGGPAAGRWWPAQAVQLVHDALAAQQELD